MATVKVKNAAGAWESVAVAHLPGSNTGGELAHAAITYTSTYGATKKFDISNYIPATGTIYVTYSYNSYYYTVIITDGELVGNYTSGTGNLFSAQYNNTHPKVAITNGVLGVTGSTATNVSNMATVIYVA